jgi:prevent-host-death family protein
MQTITAKEARDGLAEVINQVAYGGEHYVLTRRGSSLVAIIPFRELEFLERMMKEQEDAEDIRDAEEALEDIKKHGTISMEAMKDHLGIDVSNRIRKKRSKTARSSAKARRRTYR